MSKFAFRNTFIADYWGHIIYVGKAKNLKNRVLQYFTNKKDRAPKVEEMIHNIHSIKYVVTDTEFTTEKKSDKSGLTQHDLDEAQIIYSYLKKNKKKILSYWIPDIRLKEPGLDGTVSKIVEKISMLKYKGKL